MAEFAISGVLQASYKYDFAGRQAIRSLSGGVTIHSVFDCIGNRIAEYDEATGALIREYVWFNGAPLAVIEGGVTTFIRADHIGRPVFGTNTGGTKVWTASYLPFGGVRTSTGTPINARFPGQWFQSESGLHQNWMRDYDPTTGRYLQADPLGLVDGASIYGYAGQNPAMNADPTGECFGPFIAWAPACAAAAWAAISVYIGWLLDPDCYTWEEAGRDAAIGAAFGPLGGYGRAAAAGASAAARYADDAARAAPGFVAATGTRVTGYTTHGWERAWGNVASKYAGGRAGTKPSAIVDALVRPKKVVTGIDEKMRPYQTFSGNNARVTINPSTGKIVTVNPLGRNGVR